MRLLILAAAGAVAASAYAAKSDEYQIRHAADLVAVCATDPSAVDYPSAIAFCHGVLVGAVRYYDAATPAEHRFVCATPPYPTRTKVMNDFVAWAKAHPEHAQKSGIDTLFIYLAETFPCKK